MTSGCSGMNGPARGNQHAERGNGGNGSPQTLSALFPFLGEGVRRPVAGVAGPGGLPWFSCAGGQGGRRGGSHKPRRRAVPPNRGTGKTLAAGAGERNRPS